MRKLALVGAPVSRGRRVSGSMNTSGDARGALQIAILGTRGMPARYGGFETFAEQLSKRLVSRGHQVTVYGRCSWLSRWGLLDPIDGVIRRQTPTIFHKYLETPIHAVTSFIDVLFRAVDVIILCNGANSPFVPLLMLKGVPRLINVDGIERHRAKWNALGKAWYRLGERCSVWFASEIVSDAEVIAAYYRDTYSIESTVIPYGVHPTPRAPGDVLRMFGLSAKRYLLYVSRLEPENNAFGVIQAYTRLETNMPLVIVGDAPYALEYKEKLLRAANDKVIFTGFQFGEPYQELQSNCYLYIQATEVGGTHPALIESMSYGNCVVVNGTPENIEVVSSCGEIFEKNNFEELSRILARLLSEPERVESLGASAARRVNQQYSWDAVLDRYEKLMRRLVCMRRQ